MKLRWTTGDAARYLTRRDLRDRARRILINDAGHGHDRFGMSAGGIALGLGITSPLYEKWFRVQHYGLEHVPSEGGAILASNHSGSLPLDGMMIWADIARNSTPPRVPRVLLDHFVNELPWINIFFTRSGAFGGSRGNMHALLESGELVLVFPEGVTGIGKPFSERYRLQRWTEGHAEMAIRHQVPIVPTAVIGAEEQLPQVARIPIKAFGSPYIPITASPVPLPVRYHIHYGAPIPVVGRFTPEQATDPDAVESLTLEVRDQVAALIEAGLEQRVGVFA
jgi:1-acyl-sn-glycerol-3-phosphate acyltransferase